MPVSCSGYGRAREPGVGTAPAYGAEEDEVMADLIAEVTELWLGLVADLLG